MAVRAAFTPSSWKVDVSAVPGIPPENSWPHVLWLADSRISELQSLERKRYKKLRANQEVLVFHEYMFLSLSKFLETQFFKVKRSGHESHLLVGKKIEFFYHIYIEQVV